jgi:hypothetical protein
MRWQCEGKPADLEWDRLAADIGNALSLFLTSVCPLSSAGNRCVAMATAVRFFADWKRNGGAAEKRP